ncbi:hypothetical protein [Chelatococcus reniformis]|uniref:Uncharacterized protein n=1 Tax=Chelatococcus reniformis TaxID=1494448 RepID=A0A916UHD3_9HYPH|nr:hypothetical protein [Chelatococcus reniformis]GGC73406.1 hypothetical protein GCM10010994_34760 [Chelatococcus reniformis]
MIVHGDRAWIEGGDAKLDGISRDLAAAASASGIGRHGRLVAAFIQATALVRGLADANPWRQPAAQRSAQQEAAMALLMRLAEAVCRSWESCFGDADLDVAAELGRLRALDLPRALVSWDADGFSHHRVYPEAHGQAASDFAASLRGHREPQCVIVVGIGGVGTGLAAIVAAALGAPPPFVVGPVADAPGSEPVLPADLFHAATADPARLIAIVDGGRPFDDGALRSVAAALVEAGVGADRIHLFPTELPAARGAGQRNAAGEGASWAASCEALPCHAVETEHLLLHAPNPRCRLAAWITDLTGPLTAPLEDLSYGRWRERRFRAPADWPPANPRQEQLKFLAESETGPWLVKFAGLGGEGLRKAALAEALAEAGFTPAVAGFRHGFIVERWIDQSGALELPPSARPAFIAHLGRYLGFRAGHLPLPEGFVCTPLDELLVMARRNTASGLGEAAGEALAEGLHREVGRLERMVRPAAIDGRLQRWEWLVLPDGGLLKADAVDHHAGPELVSGQDIAWDVAGAICEFDLTEPEQALLVAELTQSAQIEVSAALTAFLLPCYAAYQLGQAVMGAAAVAGSEDESVRMRALSLRYARRLERLVPAPRP